MLKHSDRSKLVRSVVLVVSIDRDESVAYGEKVSLQWRARIYCIPNERDVNAVQQGSSDSIYFLASSNDESCASKENYMDAWETMEITISIDESIQGYVHSKAYTSLSLSLCVCISLSFSCDNKCQYE
jgi:hypothetical protein